MLKRRCMFGTCEVCKNNRISYDTPKGNDEVEFSQWTSKIEKRLVKEEEKNITLTAKETMEMSASDLVNKFEDELVSDGPTTQYRQKGNFYLACTNLPKYGFQNFCWNFFEAGHGKGIPDAVGGALKRHADTEVKFGKDITNADIFLDCMSNSESVGYLKEYEIAYRNISCTCQEPSDCSSCTGQEIKFSRIVADKKQQEVKTKLKPQSLESPYAVDLTEENRPNDVPDIRALFPCKVSSDGNCLPSCGSVFAHKSEFKASEIRLKLVVEVSPLYSILYEQLDRYGELVIHFNERLHKNSGAKIDLKVKFVIGNPEQFVNELLKNKLSNRIAHIVVDEAHCVVQWEICRKTHQCSGGSGAHYLISIDSEGVRKMEEQAKTGTNKDLSPHPQGLRPDGPPGYEWGSMSNVRHL
ncbi:unnamed protein product [Mytilus edulis]|uniref:Helicase ATP-binding domain-containing protein n=1 Tax=Mytilus edulis TaxID=6550 RepID=A0A8S3VR39_MYTED|nr:unnamed protein product [Mytilus edulis]